MAGEGGDSGRRWLEGSRQWSTMAGEESTVVDDGRREVDSGRRWLEKDRRWSAMVGEGSTVVGDGWRGIDGGRQWSGWFLFVVLGHDGLLLEGMGRDGESLLEDDQLEGNIYVYYTYILMGFNGSRSDTML